MSVTEQLMGWGAWSITLKDDTTPGSVWDILDPSVNAYGHILITSARVDPASGDAAMLSMAKYAGIYRGNMARNQIGGIGLVGWLGDEDDKGDIAETPVTGTGGGGFDDWINDILPASISAGTIDVIAGTLTESMQYMSPRQMLARVMDYFGGVYRVNPDFTLDAGEESDLFDTTPTVLLKYNASGPDLGLRGIRASKIDLARDLEDYTTRVVMLAEGSGTAIAVGSANIGSVPFKDGLGNNVVFKRLINAPDVSSGNANTLAAAQLGRFNDLRKSYSLSTDEWGVIFGDVKRLEPGDHIWVYDPRPDAALYDPANEINYQGETLMPVAMRLEAITWPVQEGMGVYFRYWNGSGFSYLDLSNHVVYETGDTTLDVGAAQRRLTSDPTAAQVQARVIPSGAQQVGTLNSRTFTNTSFADLDALTGGSGTIPAHAVTVQTGTRALVGFGASTISNTGGTIYLSYRVSGDTTIAAADTGKNLRNSDSALIGASYVDLTSALTPGTNTFELQARVSGGTGTLTAPELWVIPLP